MNFNLVRIWPVAARYAAAISAIVITIAVCSAIGGAAAERPFIPLYFATLLTAVLAGPGPGVLATVLSALLGDYFFLAPIGSLAVDASRDVFRLAVFEVAALLSILGVAGTDTESGRNSNMFAGKPMSCCAKARSVIGCCSKRAATASSPGTRPAKFRTRIPLFRR